MTTDNLKVKVGRLAVTYKLVTNQQLKQAKTPTATIKHHKYH